MAVEQRDLAARVVGRPQKREGKSHQTSSFENLFRSDKRNQGHAYFQHSVLGMKYKRLNPRNSLHVCQ